MRALFTFLFAVSLAGAIPGTARSQARRLEPDHLVLARVCVHEAGWDSPADCSAIAQVLRSGAERHGISFRSFARAYSGRALRGRTSRPWVAELDLEGNRPRSWPLRYRGGAHPSWSGFRDRWLAVLESSRAILAGEVPPPCDLEPDDWGGAMDAARARRLRLIPVECGATRNRFYRRPRLPPRPLSPRTSEEPTDSETLVSSR